MSPGPGILNSFFLFPNEPVTQSTNYCSEAAIGGSGEDLNSRGELIKSHLSILDNGETDMSYDTPEAILKLARQFMESRILLSAAEMNLFTLLEEKPSSAEDLAGRLHADPRGLTILLDALAAMGLLAKEAGTYRTAPDAAPFLTDKSPRSVRPDAPPRGPPVGELVRPYAHRQRGRLVRAPGIGASGRRRTARLHRGHARGGDTPGAENRDGYPVRPGEEPDRRGRRLRDLHHRLSARPPPS